MVAAGILITVGQSISILLNSATYKIMTPVAYYAAMLLLVVMMPQTIFIIKFFMLKRNCLLWLYVSFGLGLILSLISSNWFGGGLYLIFGWVVWDYITKKKVDGQPVFT